MLHVGSRCCGPPTLQMSATRVEDGNLPSWQREFSDRLQTFPLPPWQPSAVQPENSDFKQLSDLVKTLRSEYLATSERHEDLLTRLLESQAIPHTLPVKPAPSDIQTPDDAHGALVRAASASSFNPHLVLRASQRAGSDAITASEKKAADAVINLKAVDKTSVGCFRWFINSGRFDMAMGVLICLNIVFMCVDLEKKGSLNYANLQMKEYSGFWSNTDDGFEFVEHFFNAVFFLEVLLRIAANGFRACRSGAFIFDCLIVMTSAIDYLSTYVLHSSGANVNFLRVARLIKLVKLFKTFKAAAAFSQLRILIRTLVHSILALVWSCILLFFILMTCSILLTQLLAPTINDESRDLQLRSWLFEHYGSFSRSFYTLFECTLSNAWVGQSRVMVFRVHILYVVFWAFYVMLVVFAVMKVVSALFLEQTLKIAASDADMMLSKKEEEKEHNIEMLRLFLEASDEDGNGQMHQDELDALLDHEDIQVRLLKVGLESHEVQGLFHLLRADKLEVNHKDLLDNMMRLSVGVRAMDTVMLMHQQAKLAIELDKISHRLGVPS